LEQSQIFLEASPKKTWHHPFRTLVLSWLFFEKFRAMVGMVSKHQPILKRTE
jgi:hypothetical protein